MHTVTKTYTDLPAAHRQPRHKGHCSLIHGHNWAFHITFGCEVKDDNNFVVDVGKLSWVKNYLIERFDHTLLINRDDPVVQWFRDTLGNDRRAKIIVVDNCGMEGLAEMVHNDLNDLLLNPAIVDEDTRARRVRVTCVTCFEDTKNAATFRSDVKSQNFPLTTEPGD